MASVQQRIVSPCRRSNEEIIDCDEERIAVNIDPWRRTSALLRPYNVQASTNLLD